MVRILQGRNTTSPACSGPCPNVNEQRTQHRYTPPAASRNSSNNLELLAQLATLPLHAQSRPRSTGYLLLTYAVAEGVVGNIDGEGGSLPVQGISAARRELVGLVLDGAEAKLERIGVAGGRLCRCAGSEQSYEESDRLHDTEWGCVLSYSENRDDGSLQKFEWQSEIRVSAPNTAAAEKEAPGLA